VQRREFLRDAALLSGAAAAIEKHSFEIAMDEGYFERVGYEVRPSAMARGWAHG
jgi:hypothetical protein